MPEGTASYTDPQIDVQDDPRYSDNLRAVRQWGESNEARAKAAELKAKELEDRLAAVELEGRQVRAAETAKKAGLTDEQYTTLLEFNPDPTPEAIEKFASAFVTNRVETGDENQVEDLMPGSAPERPTAPPAPISGGTPKGGSGKDFSTEDFVKVARSGDEAALRQMAELVARDPSRLTLKHGEMIPE